jgi:hypothetical protein
MVSEVKDCGRQWVLASVTRIDHTMLQDGAVAVSELPPDAVVVGGQLIVQTAFSGGTLDVGDADTADRYADGVAASVAKTDLSVTGHQSAGTEEILVTPSAAPTSGEALLIIEYVREGRSNENQG